MALVMLSWTSQAFARFNHEDADQIDSDYNLNTETYNDVMSYRWPVDWRQQWDESRSGGRVTAGSLTMTRFYYLEEIRLDPAPLGPFSIAFEQGRQEDYAESMESREVRLGIKLNDWMRFLVLGDGGALKEYGDVGLGLRLFESESHFSDVYYWSVDHYYNEKNHEIGAFRDAPTKTLGVRSKRLVSLDLPGWEFRGEADLPFEWTRPSRGKYAYERVRFDGKASWRALPRYVAFTSLSQDVKRENWKSIDRASGLGIHRKVSIAEFGLEQDLDLGSNLASYSFSLLFLNRETRWLKTGGGERYQQWTPDNPPDESLRREVGADFRRYSRLTSVTSLTNGLIVNAVQIDEAPARWQSLEVKYVTALKWDFSPKSGFGLNATWDIDQVTRDFPYSKAAFRPWGGGNIQAQVVF